MSHSMDNLAILSLFSMRIALLTDNAAAAPLAALLAQQSVLCGVFIPNGYPKAVNAIAQYVAAPLLHQAGHNKQNGIASLTEWLLNVQPDALYILSFPWILPEHIFSMPLKGCYNFHLGLLPEMRGADPIFECIRQQKVTSGVTIHHVTAGIDHGNIVAQEEVEVYPFYTYGILSAELSNIAASLSQQLTTQLLQGNIPLGMPQNEAKAQYFPAIRAENLFIDWEQQTADDIYALVNASNPIISQGVVSYLQDWALGLISVSIVDKDAALGLRPGSILVEGQHPLIATCDGRYIKPEIIYLNEGYFIGSQLLLFGLETGMSCSSL